MRAFMSYQTVDKQAAARVAGALTEFDYTAFMAHDHIEVSEEWRSEILRQLEVADLFVPILSAHYYGSVWCMQESGIAAFRRITIIPLSIDGALPPGFLAHIQSTKIDPAAPTVRDLLPGLARHNAASVIDKLVAKVGKSSSFRGAEANFELILPYIGRATREQIVGLLNASTANKQVCHASLCATNYLPPLVESHGQFMKSETLKELEEVLANYKKK
jgi:TIR domain